MIDEAFSQPGMWAVTLFTIGLAWFCWWRVEYDRKKIYGRMVNTMIDRLGYCEACARKTVEYFNK